MRDNDSIYYDLYHEGENKPEQSKGAKIVTTVFKTIGITLIVAVYAILFYRIWSQQEPSGAKKYLWTAHAIEVSETLRGEGKELEILSQTPRNYEYHDDETGETIVVRRDEYYTSERGSEIDGNYKFSYFNYTPAAGQVQLSFRYNRAVLPYLMEDFGVSVLPEYPFVFALQAADGTLYTDYEYVAVKRGLHTYRRLVFEGLPESAEELGSALYLNVYADVLYGAGVDLSKPYLSMVVYDENLPTEEQKEKAPSRPAALQPSPAYVKSQENESGEK